jgi:flagellar protein FlbD
VILVTRLNGPAFAVNPDLIERAESTPDTVLTLVDGSRFVVAEPVEELIARIRDYRASVLAAAHVLEVGSRAPRQEDVPVASLTVVPLHRREV